MYTSDGYSLMSKVGQEHWRGFLEGFFFFFTLNHVLKMGEKKAREKKVGVLLSPHMGPPISQSMTLKILLFKLLIKHTQLIYPSPSTFFIFTRQYIPII